MMAVIFVMETILGVLHAPWMLTVVLLGIAIVMMGTTLDSLVMKKPPGVGILDRAHLVPQECECISTRLFCI
jgi:hypothetical protein